MPSSRSIVAFAVKFLVVYGALAASWPLSRAAYAFFLRESGMVLLEAVGARNSLRIRAATVPDGMKDTLLVAPAAAAGRPVEVTISSWLIGFQPTSLLIGLVVATPLSARRRIWALIAGLVLVHAFVLARLTMFPILAPVVLPNTFWTRALRWSVFDFFHGHGVSCFVPVLIWIAVAVRWEDARRLVGSARKEAS